MHFDLALRLAAFFLGAFLHGILVLGVLGRGQRRPADQVLRLFFFAIFLWHFGSFLGLALSGAGGPGASLLRRSVHAGAFAGLAFLPALLLHAVMSEGYERTGRRAPWERFVLALAYLPVLGLAFPLWQILRSPERPPLQALAPLVVPWNAWFVVVLLVAAGLARSIARRHPGEPGRLFRGLAWSFVGIAVGLSYTYVLDGRSGPFGSTVETLVMASSIAPTLVFVYHAYRYRVLGYFVRDRAVTLLASASFVAFYLFLVRLLTRAAEAAFGIPAVFLDGAILVVLIVLFEPYGDRLRALAHRTLGGGRERLRRSAARCAGVLAQARSVDDVAAALRANLEGPDGVAMARLLVTAEVLTGSPDVKRLEESAPQLAAELRQGGAVIGRDTVRSAAALAELEQLTADVAIALWTQDRLLGALVVRAREGEGLSADGIEALAVVAQGAGLALRAASLLADKLAAERTAARAERMATIGWLTASVAHEVKNPLSSLKAVAQVMRSEQSAGSRWHQDLELIVREADRMRDAIERLLVAAREGSGPGVGRVDLAAVLDRMTVALEQQAHRRGVRIECDLLAAAPAVAATGDALWEILYNLAANGIDAMTDGGVLRIEQRVAAAPDQVRLRIGDDGPGIDPATAERVFEPFFTTKASGHGLGLFIVRRQLQEIGGSIELIEGSGGATFEVLLPAARPMVESVPAESPPATPPTTPESPTPESP